MKQSKFSKQSVFLYCFGMLQVIWIGLLIAPYIGDGLPSLFKNFSSLMKQPFSVQICEDSLKTVLTLLLIYWTAIGVYLSTDRNYRRREEHGSAKWGIPEVLNKKYAEKRSADNKILTQHVSIGMNGRKHRRNLNTLVIGGTGAGKTRFFAKPNLMNCNCSYMVLDPKGELLATTGRLLSEKYGYEVKVLDLINMDRSHCYNPFVYLRNDNDIQRLVTNLFKNTTPKGAQTQELSRIKSTEDWASA